MIGTQQDFAAAHYGPRAADYVTSIVHAAGPDLDRIEALLTGRSDAAVLDLGCGGGHVSYRAAPHVARVVAVDVTAEMLAQVCQQAEARGLKNIETRQAAAEALPFAAASFDVVLTRFSAHHWQDFWSGLREARRVLKPGGLAVFIDTIAPAEPGLDTFLQSVELLRDVSHVRNYAAAEWVAALGAAGFILDGFETRRLRLDFRSWTARTRTPDAMVAAIRQLQQGAPDHAKTRFAIGADGGFEIDVASFRAVAG
jgi:SAM-dependent methyltransferase